MRTESWPLDALSARPLSIPYAPAMADLRLAYSRALDELDPQSILACFADDIVITVAVHDAPMVGTDGARFLFAALSEELRDFHVTKELIEATLRSCSSRRRSTSWRRRG